MRLLRTLALILAFSATSTASAQFISYPIKVNSTRATHSTGTFNHDCVFSSSADDFVTKPIDTRRDFNFTSMSTSRRNQFYTALTAASVPGSNTTKRANINFNIQADASTGLLGSDAEGDITMSWNACIDLEVVKLSNGDTRRLTFYWNEVTPGDAINSAHPCWRGAPGAFQQYEEITTDLSGMVFLSHEIDTDPMTSVITDDVTLGGSLFVATASGLPINGDFVDHMVVLELAAAEDNIQDFDLDGFPPNGQMGFLFGHYTTAVTQGADPAAELLDYRIQLGVTGLNTATCSAVAGAGEQGMLEIDTEQAFLSFQ